MPMSYPNSRHPPAPSYPSNWCNTTVKVIKCDFAWTIENFSVYAEKCERKLTSCIFPDDTNRELRWRLQVCLEPRPKHDDVVVSLELCSDIVVEAEYTISILDSKQIRKRETSCPIRKYYGEYKRRQVNLVDIDTLLDKTNSLLYNDVLTLYCEVTAYTDSVGTLCKTNSIPRKVSECYLSEDLKSLFESKCFSDVTLSVNGLEIPAHKSILVARSRVFAAMFEHEMKESKRNRIEISDADHKVIREMVYFMYTGKAPNVGQMAESLLVVADKYALKRLKEMCEEAIRLTLTTESVLNVLVFADRHNADELKAGAIEFINAHAPDVMKTDCWKNFIECQPHLVGKLFHAVVTQKA